VPAAHAQLPPTQEKVGAHATQAEPAVPHWLAVGDETQVLPLQQPPQLELSHTQLPPEQCCPAAHCAPEPQEQLPFEQLSEEVMLHGKQLPPRLPTAHFDVVMEVMHWPAEQQPLGHEVLSQMQPRFMSQR
jgi:hypothetical protein